MTTTDSNTIQQDITQALIIIKSLNLKAEVTGAWVWVHGNLKTNVEARKTLKAAGFKFAIKKSYGISQPFIQAVDMAARI